ncbi:MAG: hypothetical protein F9K32_04535 [Desulfobulbaceae bacterium]|nr:MAG: hypothetical protein F9K32_04535 [Desulfobulbaceae bacterium]
MLETYLDQAEKLIKSGDTRQLYYAAFELRLAIEKHVYEKLTFFSKRYGEKLLYENWQPNKALKVLCQLEPYADQSYTLSVAHEKEIGVPGNNFIELGHHKALSISWISKHYNKIGSYLHLQAKSQIQLEIPLQYLQEILFELRNIDESDLIMSFPDTVSFNCPLCKTQITCSTLALPHLEKVICISMNCNATFIPKKTEERWSFKLNAVDFECPECSNIQPILIDEIQIGSRITCTICKKRSIVVGNTWRTVKESINKELNMMR